MIDLTDITKTYYIGEIAVRALQGVTLTIEPGEFVAIMGPSGSGKSTLLHVLGLLDRPDSGQYRLWEQDVPSLSEDDLAGLRNERFGFVFQQFHLLQRVTALDNVSLPLIYSGPNGDLRSRAAEKLTAVGLEDRMRHCPNELSGGQQQRVAIARALIKDPMIIFADEPTGNLDSQSQQEILQILKGLNDEGKTIVVVTHDEEVARYAHRVIRMRDGKIISDQRQGAQQPAGPREGNISRAGLPRRSVWHKNEWIVHLRQAVRAVTSNKVRSLLSMLGILVGVAAVIAMMALGEGAKVSMEESLKSLGSNLLTVRGGSSRLHGAAGGAGTITRFTPRDIETISGLSGLIAKVSAMVRGSAQVVYLNENWNTRVEGVDHGYGEMRAAIPKTGRWFTREEIRARDKVAILGTTVSQKLFGDRNPVGETVKINRVNFRVIGITPEKGFAGPNDQDDIIYIPVTTAMYRLLGKDYYDTIYIEVTSPDKIDEAKTRVEETLRKHHRLYQDEDSFSIRDMSEIKNMLSATTKTMGVLLGCIAAISLFVGGIGIMNIMLVSVTERTREIGLRKAIGARKADIMMQFLIESVVMTLSGGIMGILLGVGAAAVLAHFAGWATRISLFSVLLATVFSVGVGICFGLWPAQKAAQMNPVEALRYE